MEIVAISKGSTTASGSLAPRLRAFKEQFCDENVLIAEALKGELRRHIYAPILDVGAGLGDIARASFPDVEAILLDAEEWSGATSPLHKRVVANFFEYAERKHDAIGTLLLCHVLQYLDEEPARLVDAVSRLAPKSVVAVLNDNTDAFGELVHWAEGAISGANPEIPLVPVDPTLYRVVGKHQIAADMTFPNFSIMAEHFVSVLLDAEVSPEALELTERRLRSALERPTVIINETITCYERIS